MPLRVIQQAKQKLQELENHAHLAEPVSSAPKQSDLFAQIPEEHVAIKLLKQIDPDKLTPREALDFIFKLKERV